MLVYWSIGRAAAVRCGTPRSRASSRELALSENQRLDRTINGISDATLSVNALERMTRLALFPEQKLPTECPDAPQKRNRCEVKHRRRSPAIAAATVRQVRKRRHSVQHALLTSKSEPVTGYLRAAARPNKLI